MTGVVVRAQHDDCELLNLNPKDIKVTITPNQLYGTYEFQCPICNQFIIKTASQVTLDRLIDIANAPFYVEDPSPFTTQDLITFHKLLSPCDEARSLDEPHNEIF